MFKFKIIDRILHVNPSYEVQVGQWILAGLIGVGVDVP
jgi:hypothetical protein